MIVRRPRRIVNKALQLTLLSCEPIDQGTTEALSKHWMPLDEFTGHTIEGLQKGEFQNIVPAIRHVWEQCEAPKLAMLDKARQLFASK